MILSEPYQLFSGTSELPSLYVFHVPGPSKTAAGGHMQRLLEWF